MSRTICIYHKNCFDGICAAWVVSRFYPDALFHPMAYGESLPWDIARSDNVVMVDFSLKAKPLQELALRVTQLTVIDHHKTAEAELRDFRMSNVIVKFDMNESGASLAWQYFFPGITTPRLVQYIKDRDLWRFNLHSSEIINAYIQSFAMDIKIYDELATELENGDGFVYAQNAGIAILRYKNQMVENICSTAVLNGAGIPTVNTSLLFAEVNNYLCRKYPDAPYAQYYYDRICDGVRQWGVASIGDFDVSEVAKRHGGGGHKNAAGWTEPLPIIGELQED